MKRFFLFSLLNAAVLAAAGEYADTVRQAEQTIAIRYANSFQALKIAERELQEIVDSDAPEAVKTGRIRERWLTPPAGALPADRLSELVVVPPVTWEIHSIRLDRNPVSRPETLFSSATLNAAGADAAPDEALGDLSDDLSSRAEKTSVRFPHARFDDLAAVPFRRETMRDDAAAFPPAPGEPGQKARQSVGTRAGSVDRWGLSARLALAAMLSGGQARTRGAALLPDPGDDLRFSFTLALHNHTDLDLKFLSAATVPVCAGDTVLFTARMRDSWSRVKPLPANSVQDFVFSGEVPPAQAQVLLEALAQGTFRIDPLRGEFKIAGDAVHDALLGLRCRTLIPVSFAGHCWMVCADRDKPVTLGQALEAVDQLYRKQIFRKTDDGVEPLVNLAIPPHADLFPAVEFVGGNHAAFRFPADLLDQPLATVAPRGLKLHLVTPRELLVPPPGALRDLPRQYFVMQQAQAAKGDPDALRRLAWCYLNGCGTKAAPEKAVEPLTRAAEKGCTVSQYALGLCCLEGRGTVKAPEAGIAWLTRAAQAGDVRAQNRLACCFELGIGTAPDPARAVHWFRQAAERGDLRSMTDLAICCELGTGTKADPAQAAQWYARAAERGYAQAQYLLGNAYRRGAGVARDLPEALRQYRLAAAQGHAKAQFLLGYAYAHGEGVTKDPAQAVHYYRQAGKRGHARALNSLGVCYCGGIGVRKDPALGVRCYRAAAQRGHAGGQLNLALCLQNGIGVAKDAAEAVQWFRKAAEQGNEGAQLNLGHCYRQGLGVKQDDKAAAEWYRKAAAQGNAVAQYTLGNFHLAGVGVELDRYEAANWYHQAALQGYAPAQYAMGVCYATGRGVKQDRKEAAKWFGKAAAQGDKAAYDALRRLDGK